MTRRATPENVGQRLAAARLQRGLTQIAVAQSAGLAPSYLSRVENGKIHPTFRTVMRVTKAVGASMEEIVGPESPSSRKRGPCPVTTGGQCLIDLIGPGSNAEQYTPREVRLLRRFAAWIKTAHPSRVRAIELLIDEPGEAG